MGEAHPQIVINRSDDTEVARLDLFPSALASAPSWDTVMSLVGAKLGELRAPAGGYNVIILGLDGQPVLIQPMTWPGTP